MRNKYPNIKKKEKRKKISKLIKFCKFAIPMLVLFGCGEDVPQSIRINNHSSKTIYANQEIRYNVDNHSVGPIFTYRGIKKSDKAFILNNFYYPIDTKSITTYNKILHSSGFNRQINYFSIDKLAPTEIQLRFTGYDQDNLLD